uniref:Uncharacterized protein n=1 Tax=Bionectria ochroleuca TaxID=29856 RepID=A0A8H7KBQ5_BIOOC
MGTSTQTNSPLIKEKTLAQQINSEDPSPVKTLNLYKRIWPGKKCLFAPSGGEPAQYFIKNPVPHKHASQWKPVFYRGDNPKYDPDSIAVSRGFRTGFWNSFRFEHGDGVDMVLKNKRRVSARKWHRRKTKMRGWFGKPEKPPKKPLEDEEEVEGLVMEFRMHRPRFITRTLSFELNGEKYIDGVVRGGFSQIGPSDLKESRMTSSSLIPRTSSLRLLKRTGGRYSSHLRSGRRQQTRENTTLVLLLCIRWIVLNTTAREKS